jgi:hypothetical protein
MPNLGDDEHVSATYPMQSGTIDTHKEIKMKHTKLIIMGAAITGVIGGSTLAQAQGLAWKLKGGGALVTIASPTEVPRNVGAVIPVRINLQGENYDDLADLPGSTLTKTKGVPFNASFACSSPTMTNTSILAPEQTNKLGAKHAVTVTNGTIENLRITSCRSPRMNPFPDTHNGLAYIGMTFNVRITRKANEQSSAGTATITYDTNPNGGTPATAIIGGIK